MNDMSSVIVPKSDQINADDLIAGPMTITIRDVQIRGGQEQPVSIYFEGSDKAFRPCKSMSRVLVQGWGADAKAYIGRSLTLYRDPTVKWAGLEVGGIRISHMSNIDGEKLMMLTATKGSRKPHKVLPLVNAPASSNPKGAVEVATILAELEAVCAPGQADRLAQAWREIGKDARKALADELPRLKGLCDPVQSDDEPSVADEAVAKMKASLEAAPDAAAVENIINEAQPHIAFLDDDVVVSLEIAFDQARKRFEEPVG